LRRNSASLMTEGFFYDSPQRRTRNKAQANEWGGQSYFTQSGIDICGA